MTKRNRNGEIKRQTLRETDRQKESQTDRDTGRETDRTKKTYIHTNRQTKKTDRRTD